MSIAAIAAAIDSQLGGSFAPPYTKSDIQTRVATALYNSLQVGVTANTAAGAGEIGEVKTVSRLNSNALATVSSGAQANVCTTPSITLTPGDWSVAAMLGFTTADTLVTAFFMGVSATSATNPSIDNIAAPNGAANGEARVKWQQAASVAGGIQTFAIPPYQVLVAAATTLTLYLVGAATYTGSAVSQYGWLQARRMR